MFRISEKVPEVYMKESRDFQILPRLDDLLFLGEHYDISTIQELNNPKKCRNSCLKYLAEKVGFYTNKYIPDNVLINIISAFRTALKNKGTELGILQAVTAILKAENSVDPPKIVYIKDNSQEYYEQYTINIYTPIKILNEIALREFLRYIIPAGCNYNIYPYEDANLDQDITEVNYQGTLGLLSSHIGVLGEIRSNLLYDGKDEVTLDNPSGVNLVTIIPDDKNIDTNLQDRLIGIADIGVIVPADDLPYSVDKNTGKVIYNEQKININTSKE